MFCGAELFDANLLLWNVTNVRDMSFMFAGAASFRGMGLQYWNTKKVESLAATFATFELLESMLDVFNDDVTPINLSKNSAFDANLSAWDVSRVRDFSHMFSGAYMFQGAGVEYWKTNLAWTMVR